MNFIDAQILTTATLDKSYNLYLIILSIIIAVISSYTAFGMSERIHASTNRREQIIWVFFGAMPMGIGIWSMHFIGSLALTLPIPISYDLSTTIISIAPAVLASSAVLWYVNRAECDIKHLLFCGFLLGSGIGAMHYIGMAAMRLNAEMFYIKPIFILSLVIAVILATIALKIKFDIKQHANYQFINFKQLLSALIMGSAVSGMHYTAMQAVVFIPTSQINTASTAINASFLSAAIGGVILFVLTMALVIPYILRFREISLKLQQNEEALKIAAMAFQTHEAIIVADAKHQIIQINDAFKKITGYSETEALGEKTNILNADYHDNSFYEKFWNTIEAEGKGSGEIWVKGKDGIEFPTWQTCTSVKSPDGNISHYISFFSDITDFKSAEKEIEQLAFYDSLTDLPNRRLLHERLDRELVIARRYQRAGIIFFLDLDRFKHINDSLGHAVGDRLLVETASRLQSLLRESDTAVRLGGDEFIIMVSAQDGIQMDLVEQSNTVAKKIIEIINAPYLIDNHELFISTSIGITIYTGQEDESVDLLLKRADTAMYQAKDAGRNTFRFYLQSMQDVIDSSLKIERYLHHSITNNELYLEYQPQISDTNTLIAVEALLRWKNAELGQISPAEFIPIAEENGFILKLGDWVIDNVLKQMNQWEDEGLEIPHVSINISAKQFHLTDFVSHIIQKIYDSNIDPDRIVLEITESVFLSNIEQVIDKMHTLKQIGFKFAIDDFGIGYSSLTYLKRLPFDQLKIDQSFVQGLIEHPSDAAIVKAIIVMAKSLKLDLIAEGIETYEHLAFLSSFGCHQYQGYYFSKPLLPAKLTEFIKKNNKN